MVTFNYDDTFTGSVETLKEAVSQLGVSASSSAVAIAQAVKAMIGLGGYSEYLTDSYSILGGNGNTELMKYSHAEGAQAQTQASHAEGSQTQAAGNSSWAIGRQNTYGITIDDRDRNIIFSISNTPEKPVKLLKEDDNPFYIDPEVIKQGGWLDSDID